jgi:transcriptional regulator with XRE-family HTH domain
VIEKQETAKRIKTFRRLQNLNQEDFASLLNVSKSRISQVETTGEISVDVYRKLKHLYPKLNLNWLMVGEGEMYVDQKAEPGLVVQDPTVAYGEPVGTGTDVPEKELLARMVQVVGDMQAKLAAHEGRLAALERALGEEGNQTT